MLALSRIMLVSAILLCFFLMIRRPPRSTRTGHTLSLHDALPIWSCSPRSCSPRSCSCVTATRRQHFALAHVIGSRDQTLFLHALDDAGGAVVDRKSTRLNSSH